MSSYRRSDGGCPCAHMSTHQYIRGAQPSKRYKSNKLEIRFRSRQSRPGLSTNSGEQHLQQRTWLWFRNWSESYLSRSWRQGCLTERLLRERPAFLFLGGLAGRELPSDLDAWRCAGRDDHYGQGGIAPIDVRASANRARQVCDAHLHGQRAHAADRRRW